MTIALTTKYQLETVDCVVTQNHTGKFWIYKNQNLLIDLKTTDYTSKSVSFT